MNTIAFIALSFGLFTTAPNLVPQSLSTTEIVPEQLHLDAEGYLKKMLAAGGKSISSYTVLKTGNNGRYLRFNFEDNGKTYLKEFYIWYLGFDVDSDDALIMETTFMAGYGTLPSFYFYKEGTFSRPKYREVISNYDELENFIIAYEAQTSNGTSQCCDLRTYVPLEGEDIEIVTVRNEDAVKLTDRATKGIRVGLLEYDVLEEKFVFVKN